MESTIVNTLVIAFADKFITGLSVRYVYVPFHAVESIAVKDGRASIRTKAGASFFLDEEQTARLEQLLEANAVYLDDEIKP